MRFPRLALLLSTGVMPLLAQNALLDSIQMLGGAGVDSVVSITPDNAGNLFVLGSTQSADFPATATFGTTTGQPTNGRDTFVAKIQLADWSLAWSAVIRPSVPLALAIDSSGAVYLTGHTDSPANLPRVPGSFAAALSGASSALFVMKLDPTGSRILYSSLLGPYWDSSTAPIAVDSLGQAYVTALGAGPLTRGAFISTVTSGNRGAYFAKLSADGDRVLIGSYLAGSSTVTPTAIAVDGQQNIFIAGRDNEYLSTFPSTPGVVQSKHAGSDDAFLMKFRPDGASLEFATLLGGTGGDSANFLQIGGDGSIYLAGYCEYGSPASAASPFPITSDAAFRTFVSSTGFVARLTPDASSLLFSTYVSNTENAGVQGFAISAGQIYAAFPVIIGQAFLGLGYGPESRLRSTAVQTFDLNSGAATVSVLQIPALTPDAFSVAGTDLFVASNGAQINLPVPSSIMPLGPLGHDPSKSPILQSDITFSKFLLAESPEYDIETDRGYLYFEYYPGATLQQTLNLTSSADGVPFHIFDALPASCCSSVPSYSISPPEGMTPAAVAISPVSPDQISPPALLLVSPRASRSIQVLPALTYSTPVQPQAQASPIVLPAAGGPGTGTIDIAAGVTSPLTRISTPLSVPFQFDTRALPAFLTIDPLQGVTPATVKITGQIDSLQPGGSVGEFVYVTVAGQRQSVFVQLTRYGPPKPVSSGVRLTGYLGQPLAKANLQVQPADSFTNFQVLSTPPGITITPMSGTGSATLTLTADLSQFSVGATNLTCTLQLGATQYSVSIVVSVVKGSLSIPFPLNVSPGQRLNVSALGVAANLPIVGSWNNVSPAPTDWNGYRFVYRSRALPILSADPANLLFDVQFPYDLDLTAGDQPLAFLSPDGNVISTAQTYGKETPTSIALFDTGAGYYVAVKPDGSTVSSTNPVNPGDVIRLSLIGTGVTNPPIAAGLLPDPGATVSPAATLQIAIGGKTATILRQALDVALIGVTDFDIQVPTLAPGLEMLGIQSGAVRIDLIPIWIATGR